MLRIMKNNDQYTCEFDVAELKLSASSNSPSDATRLLVANLVHSTLNKYLRTADRLLEPGNEDSWKYLQESLSLALKNGWQVRATSLDIVDMGFDGTNLQEIRDAMETTGLDNIRIFRLVDNGTISFGYYYYHDADEYHQSELSLYASDNEGLYIDSDGNTYTALRRDIMGWVLSHLLDKAYE